MTAGPNRPEYEPETTDQKLGYLVEECGEVMQAVGKTFRYGLDSCNPELPEEERETNLAWVLRELDDLEVAIRYVREELDGRGPTRLLLNAWVVGLKHEGTVTDGWRHWVDLALSTANERPLSTLTLEVDDAHADVFRRLYQSPETRRLRVEITLRGSDS